MAEEVIIEKKSPAVFKIILAILVSALVFGTLGYLYGRNNQPSDVSNLATATTTSTPVLSASTTATTAATTTSTNSWKTYTNSTYGFSFNYPSSWTIINDSAGDNGSVAKRLEIIGTGKEDFQLWVNPDGFGLEGASDMYSAEILNGKISIIEHTENKPSDEFPEVFGQAVIGQITSSNINYTIAYSFDLADRTAELAKFEQIIKTFNFTK